MLQDRSLVVLELTKPRITLMVMLTVAVGYTLAPHYGGPSLGFLHVLVGAMLSCSGAGALNQYLEREVDSTMNRTRFRPLPAQRISSGHALLLGLLLAGSGVAYLKLNTNLLTALIDASILVSYLFIYTPMKRISALSTLVGAVPGALPPVMGWTAAGGRMGTGALVLFTILFLWQIPHFLAIGRLYRDDYERGGFPMLAVVDRSGGIAGRQTVLYALTLLPISLLPTLVGLAGTLYFWVACTLSLGYLGASVFAALRKDRRSARTLLLVSVVYLPALLAAMVVGSLTG